MAGAVAPGGRRQAAAVPEVDVTSRTEVAGTVEGDGRPVEGAWVRLLDPGGEFVGEVVTSSSGAFRFYVTPGRWVLRVLSPGGSAELPVEARLGRTAQVDVQLSARLPGRLEVVQIATLSLGNRSYLISDGSTAVAVDPERDLGRVTAVLSERNLRLRAVLETHLHNDYVTGGLELAREAEAEYLVPAGPRLGFDAVRVADGDGCAFGELDLRVIGTPGHTDHHLAYAFAPRGGPPQVVCTGGSLLYGSTGRTDLMGEDQAEPLAHRQYRSVRRLAELLPDDTEVLPTHGFGSFCAASQAGAADRSTIGRERAVNTVFREPEDDFVSGVLAGLEPYPAYYRRMGPINAAGPAPTASLGLPARVGLPELAERIAAGEWVVDVRPRAEFAHTHLRGTVNFDARGSLATYIGWLVPANAPLTLLAADEEELTAARDELLRIGLDHLSAVAVGSPTTWAGPRWLSFYPRADFAALAAALADRPVEILDVRSDREWQSGHLLRARHLHLPELPGAIAALPDVEFWVHCRSGFRAAIGASLLAAAGRDVVLVDDVIDHAHLAGTVTPER
jgi:glyoxylase-like metal-dependent hydrolase (beta-lactamase superfamily II)/rhodanese-related sulfurtransferase